MPPLDDELAKAASEFGHSTSCVRTSSACGARVEEELEGAFRGAAVDALVEESGVEVSDALVEARAGSLIRAFVNGLERREISLETYLAVSGKRSRSSSVWSRTRGAPWPRADPRGCGRTARNRGLGRRAARLHPRAGRIRRRGGSGRTGGRAVQRPARDAAHGPRLRAALDRVASEVKRISPSLRRTRKALDARAGEARRRCETVDPGEKEPA